MLSTSEKTSKHQALFLEGGDSVGKNELVRSIAKYILLSNPTKKVLLMNFPQFWFLGHDIRLVIRGACDDLFSETTGVENAYLRSCLYAIDRDLALLLAEPYLVSDPDIFVLSDRGPYSSCITTGYLWANGVVTEKEVKDEIVPTAFNIADHGMLSYFDSQSLLCVVNGKFHLGKRKALDNYEAELPQQFSHQVYKMMGFPEIITKEGDSWRSRIELAKEALQSTGYDEIAKAPINESEFNDDELLLNAYKQKRLILIGPELFLKHFHAEKLASQQLRKMISQWTEISLREVVKQQKDRKEVLDNLETKIALSLKTKTRAYEYLNTRRSPHARYAIALLFERYPLLKDILYKTSGKAMTTFFEGLLSAEQLRML